MIKTKRYCVYEMEVRYKRTELDAGAPVLNSPDKVVDWFKSLVDDMQEKFIVVYLNSRNKILCCNVEFTGGLTSSAVYIAPIARHALLCGAAGLVLLHNHPSGCIEPSEDDKKITRRIVAALELFDICVADHLIIGREGHYSFQEHGIM